MTPTCPSCKERPRARNSKTGKLYSYCRECNSSRWRRWKAQYKPKAKPKKLNGHKVQFDAQGRVICPTYHAKVPPATCLARTQRIAMRGVRGGNVIDWIDDPACQACWVPQVLNENSKSVSEKDKSHATG